MYMYNNTCTCTRIRFYITCTVCTCMYLYVEILKQESKIGLTGECGLPLHYELPSDRVGFVLAKDMTKGV